MENEKDFHEEIERCKDPVYFYENYWLVNGEKPRPLTDCQKELMRRVANVRMEGTPIVVKLRQNLKP